MARMVNKVTLLRRPQDGQSIKGDRGVTLRGPLDWSECSSDFRFEAGGPDDTYLDYVVYNGNYYMCTTSHSKGTSWVASRWQTAAQLPFVASMLLLAQEAVIENLIARGIIMKDDAGNVIFRAARGEVECNGGVFRAHLVAGDPTGQRIDVDPASKAVKIYDAAGKECASLTGDAYTAYTQLVPVSSASVTGWPTATRSTSRSLSAIGSIHAHAQVEVNGLASRIYTSAPGVFTFEVGAAITSLLSDYDYATSGRYGAVHVLMRSYSSSTSSTVIATPLSQTTIQQSVEGSTSGALATNTFSVFLPAGYHMVTFVVEAFACQINTSLQVYAGATLNVRSFMSRFFSGGWALTYDTANYLISMIENGVMRQRLAGEFIHTGPYSRNGYAQPYVVYVGRAYSASNTAISSLTALHNPSGASVTLAATAVKGCYTVTFPASMGLTTTNCLVEVCGYGRCCGTLQNDRPAQATVISLTGALVATIGVSDDGGHQNGGGFQIKVSKFS